MPDDGAAPRVHPQVRHLQDRAARNVPPRADPGSAQVLLVGLHAGGRPDPDPAKAERTESAADTRIDRAWYDESEYFEAGAHLLDFGSRFQRYRVAKVTGLYNPRPGDRVLDMGCGWGTITFALAPRVREVVGLDFSERAIAGCNANLERFGFDNVSFRVGDARDSGLTPGSFDAVVAADLFEQLYPEDSSAVAAEAHRLLRPGGTLAVWTPCRSHLLEVLRNNDIILKRDVSHVDYKSKERMTALLTDAGFEIERAYFVESHLPVLNVVERLGLRWIPPLRRRIAVLGRKPG